MNLVYTFGKQACKTPVPNGICNFLDETLTFGVRKVYVGFGVVVIFTSLFVGLLFLLSLELQKIGVAILEYFPSSLVPAQSLKIRDPGLFQIASEDPCRVQFFSSKSVFAQNPGYLTISVTPPPNWDRDSGKYEMRRVPRDIRCSGFVDITEIHFPKSLISGELATRRMRFVLDPNSRRLATHPRRDGQHNQLSVLAQDHFRCIKVGLDHPSIGTHAENCTSRSRNCGSRRPTKPPFGAPPCP